jgi:hypothetical protein
MKKSELNSLVNTEIDNAYGAFDGDLSGEIAEGIDFYLGEPFGKVNLPLFPVMSWMLSNGSCPL